MLCISELIIDVTEMLNGPEKKYRAYLKQLKNRENCFLDLHFSVPEPGKLCPRSGRS